MTLDCVVVGYNEGDFDSYRLMCEQAGPDSPEWQIYRKEHLVVDGRPVPWLDAFSRIRNHGSGQSHRYHVGEVFNLASLYLCNYLEARGVSAHPISLFGAEQDRLADLLAERPRVVAITTTFYVTILPVVDVVEFVRKHSPTSHVVVGGPLVDNLCLDGVTDSVQNLLHAMGADSYVQESQGEQALLDLCLALREGAPLDRVDNLIHCPDDAWVLTRRKQENSNLDENCIDWARFSADDVGLTAQTRTARSCAFKCSFCDYPSRAGALATASVDSVRHELRLMADKGVQNLVFVDDTFNVPPKRFKEICQMMIDEDFGFDWYSYFRCANARDDESFDLAAESGCAGVFLGIESGDEQVLANMKKLAQDSQYREGIARLKERGITTFASIIVGFPGESEATVANTIDFLNDCAPDFWRAQAWWGNVRSPVYRQKELYGIEGSGYSWSHFTMSSEEAAAHCDEMFDRVTESTWLPLYDFDFWSLPYLAGKGVSVEQLKPLLDTTQTLMRTRDAGGSPQRVEQLEREFADGVLALAADPPKFTY